MGEPEAQDEPNLSRQTLSGLQWVYAGTIGGLVLQLVYTAVMSRLLDDVEFGLVASAQVVLRFGRYASELGLGPALIQKPTLRRDDIRAGFTSSAVLGLALTAVMIAIAPAMRAFFDSEEVVPVLRVLSVTLLLNTLSIVPMSLLSRELRFRALAILEFASFGIGYLGVGLVVALLGGGVWSLVAATVTTLALTAAGAYALTRHPVRPTLSLRKAAPLYRFGGTVSVISLMEYGLQVAPSAVVGRYSGIGALGQFNRGSLLVDLPLVNATFALSRVLFPALSRIQGDRPRVRQAYLSAMRMTGAVVVPTAVGLGVAAPEVVALVLGPQWGTAAAVVPPLAVAASFAFLAHYGGIVCEALDVLRTKVALTAVLLAATIAGLLLAPTGDLLAYAWVLAAAQAAAAVAYATLMARVLSITWRQQAAVYLPTLAAASTVALAIGGVTAAGRAADLPVGVLVPLQMATGAGTLLAMALYGPLRPVRRDLAQRLRNAGLRPDSGSTALRRVFAVLDLGERTPPRSGS